MKTLNLVSAVSFQHILNKPIKIINYSWNITNQYWEIAYEELIETKLRYNEVVDV